MNKNREPQLTISLRIQLELTAFIYTNAITLNLHFFYFID